MINTSRNFQTKWKGMFRLERTQEEAWIQEYIQTETPLEYSIIQDKTWIKGAFWGEPRPGHPEGKVLYHIREVLNNIDKITSNPLDRERLRLIAILHDTFKYKEEKARPRLDWSKHHAIYAAKFAKKYIKDQLVIDIIELHDEAYYAWCSINYHQSIEKSNKRIKRLYHRLGEKNVQLYYMFFKCDTCTGDKIQKPLAWFEKTMKAITPISL